MTDNDFLLSFGADTVGIQKDIDKLKKTVTSKPIIVPIKAAVDNNFKTVLDSMKHFTTVNGKSTGNAATLGSFVNSLKKSVVGLNSFSNALGRASAAVYSLEARAKSAASGVARAGVSAPAAVAAGGATAAAMAGPSRTTANLMAVPGVAMIAQAAARGISGIKNFGMGSINLFNTQSRAETQLSQVLKNSKNPNMAAAFGDIKNYASQIQKRTMFGDEAMIAGAGELATFVKDPQQLKAMMGLLTDYAAGMSGGTEVSAQQMVDYATALGKANDGTFDSMRKKGFDTTRLEQLAKIEKDVEIARSGEAVSESKAKEIAASVKAFNEMGGDLQAEKIKALQETLTDWKGLAETFAGTDQGKIAQLKNDLGDLQETLGERLQPIIANLAVEVRNRLPEISALFDTFVQIWQNVANLIKSHADELLNFGSVLSSVLKWATRYGTFFGGMILSYKFAIPLIGSLTRSIQAAGASSAAASSGFARLGGALTGLVNTNALGLVASAIAGLGVTAITTWRETYKANMAALRDDRAKAGDKAIADYEAADKAYEATSGQPEYARRGAWEKREAARVNAENAVKLYAEANGGRAFGSWGKKFKNGLSMDNANGGFGSKIKFSINDLADEKDFQSGIDTLNSMKTAKTEVINYSPTITQNNHISTDFDSLGKLIKENLREIAISRLTFKTSSEAAKAVAL